MPPLGCRSSLCRAGGSAPSLPGACLGPSFPVSTSAYSSGGVGKCRVRCGDVSVQNVAHLAFEAVHVVVKGDERWAGVVADGWYGGRWCGGERAGEGAGLVAPVCGRLGLLAGWWGGESLSSD